MLRRQLLKTSLIRVSALVAGTLGLPTFISAFDSPMTEPSTIAITLANALRSIGSESCLVAAASLEASQSNDGDIRFHLRSAGIDASGAMIIAEALRSLPNREASSLVSLSLSYNEALGDAGAIALAHALPPTLHELGLVGCGIGDQGGEALLQWAKQAPRLRMMCIEENKFSYEIRMQFAKLAREKSRLFVIV